jgi:hypothetical protein
MALDVASFLLMLASASALGFGLAIRKSRRPRTRMRLLSAERRRVVGADVANWRLSN